jgi:hypothetical protein
MRLKEKYRRIEISAVTEEIFADILFSGSLLDEQ